MNIKSTILLIILIACSALFAQEKIEIHSLAVLVYCDGGNQELADKLQPLIEAEASLQWDGSLVERAKIDELLDEMKLTRSGLSDPDTQLQVGKMITMDCLLTVRVNKDSVKTTFSEFPSTTIIHEKEYTERLEPQSLSVNIVTNAIKAYREHNRDSLKPQVSIGSFFNAGPFKQYFDFSKSIRVQLREELVKDKSIVLTERLLPSDLLGEFEIARAGITESIAKNLSAPPSDILLYGEFKAKPEQDLTQPAAELDFTLFVISPTGLCESKKVEFSCYSNEPEIPVEKAKQLIEQVSKEVKTKLASGQKRIFSQKEFEEFKRQAFQLMPKPPKKNGNFNTEEAPVSSGMNQPGTLEELERALLMLECTMLFNSTDTQVLVCTGTILNSISQRQNRQSLPEWELFYNTSLEMIEKAYMIESNWNTRAAYYQFFVYSKGIPQTPPDIIKISPLCIKAAKHILETRHTEQWHERHIEYAYRRLLESETDPEALCQMFLDAAQEYEESKEEESLNSLFSIIFNHAHYNNENPQTRKSILNCARILLEKDSLLLHWFGHYLYMKMYAYNNRSTDNADTVPIEFAEHFKSALNVISELQKQKVEMPFSHNIEFAKYFLIYDYVLKHYNLEDDSVELKFKFITDKIQTGFSNGFEDDCIHEVLLLLLPQLWKQGEYEKGYKIITECLRNFDLGMADNLSRERTRFQAAMLNITQPGIGQLEKIEFDDGRNLKITGLIISENGIFGIRNRTLFHLIPEEKRAYIPEGIRSGVSSIARAGKYLGFASGGNGFYLLNCQNMKVQNFTPDNSSFPSLSITSVRSSGDCFNVGIRDKSSSGSLVYQINPDDGMIRLTDEKEYSTKNIFLRNDIISKNFKGSIHEDNSGLTTVIISNMKGNILINYRDYEIPRIYNFILWNEQLVFVTDNGLFISKSGSNKIHSFINDSKIVFHSLVALDDQMYIGTSEGLYCVSAEKFLEMVKQIEQTD